MMPFDAQRVWVNVRKATTEDLLNRVTAYRSGMEPEAIAIIEEELHNRGIGSQEIRAHSDQLGPEVIEDAKGLTARCSFCRAPAVAEGWGWHKLWRKLPVFPRFLRYCRKHFPKARNEEE
jgi:hypothetical protein